mgnify:CR=1 FL=1|tara:strand:+ start:616 stop:804 length:189 start_codon:yes stop_codon:yes gene_type:complete
MNRQQRRALNSNNQFGKQIRKSSRGGIKNTPSLLKEIRIHKDSIINGKGGVLVSPNRVGEAA